LSGFFNRRDEWFGDNFYSRQDGIDETNFDDGASSRNIKHKNDEHFKENIVDSFEKQLEDFFHGTKNGFEPNSNELKEKNDFRKSSVTQNEFNKTSTDKEPSINFSEANQNLSDTVILGNVLGDEINEKPGKKSFKFSYNAEELPFMYGKGYNTSNEMVDSESYEENRSISEDSNNFTNDYKFEDFNNGKTDFSKFNDEYKFNPQNNTPKSSFANNNINKKTKDGKKGFFIGLCVIVILTLVCFITAFTVVNNDMSNPNGKIVIPDGKGIEIDIPKGANSAIVADLLKEKGIIRFPFIFKLMSKYNGKEYNYGKYVISKDLSYGELLQVLGDKPTMSASVKVTIPEGYAYVEIAKLLVEKKVVNSEDEFNKAAKIENYDFDFLKSINASKLKNRKYPLEGYLFPDTYEFESGNAKDAIKKMLTQFKNKLPSDYNNKAKSLNKSVDDVITLASIVESEAKWDGERAHIAGLFYNRLNTTKPTTDKPNLIQSCATVQYILLNRNGSRKEELSRADTQIDDPYNTYRNVGLTPGPICSPGIVSLDAAFNPLTTKDFFFVATGDGGHLFATTLKDHNANDAKVRASAKSTSKK
jgi:UPF0755 protein